MIFRPLLVFLLIGCLLWGGERLLNISLSKQEPLGTIVISPADLESKDAAPFELQLNYLVAQRLLAMEALRLGIHRNDPVVAQRLGQNLHFLYRQAQGTEALQEKMLVDDPVVRRRLQERMEALLLSQDTQAAVSEERLKSFYSNHLDSYRAGKRYRLSHQLIRSDENVNPGSSDASAISFTGPQQALSEANLTRLFPAELVSGIINTVEAGKELAHNTAQGAHKIRIEAILPGEPLSFNHIRARVLADFQEYRLAQLRQDYVRDMLPFYRVVLPEDDQDRSASVVDRYGHTVRDDS